MPNQNEKICIRCKSKFVANGKIIKYLICDKCKKNRFSKFPAFKHKHLEGIIKKYPDLLK